MTVARIIVLDSGPLGDACRKRGSPDAEDVRDWLIQARANGTIVAIPEIADYEVRRGLILAGSTQGIGRLDKLHRDLGPYSYIPITTDSMRKAAELWADARRRGVTTADDKEIDADVILAAQAMLFSGLDDELIVATYNERHLSRYVNAHDWRDIKP
jgi:predicted nucleic acid-binding protein